jgi:hypothetical protein
VAALVSSPSAPVEDTVEDPLEEESEDAPVVSVPGVVESADAATVVVLVTF